MGSRVKWKAKREELLNSTIKQQELYNLNNREKRNQKNEQILRYLLKDKKKSNIYVIEVPEREEK